jgi:homoserine kinase
MPARSRTRTQSGFTIKLPATSANLGPAFDCAALALRLHLRVRARISESNEFAVRASGRDAGICEAPAGNLLLETYRSVLREAGRRALPLDLAIQNEIPIGKGCGSSAAARLAGIALAVHFGKLRWSAQQIMQEAARREGHADNATACWLGGVAIAGTGGELRVATLPAPEWPLLLAVPEQPLATASARAVLPKQVSYADAVANVQSVMLLAAAFTQRRGDLLAAILNDKLHEPYRARLCPLLAPLRQLCGKHGILGVALSGAGPSVLLFLQRGIKKERVATVVGQALRDAGLEAELIFTSAEKRGAAVMQSAAKARKASA